MADLRRIHQYMNDREQVVLDDGRVGKIVRVDTHFPEQSTTVSVWTESENGPGVTKVDIAHVLGPADKATA